MQKKSLVNTREVSVPIKPFAQALGVGLTRYVAARIGNKLGAAAAVAGIAYYLKSRAE